MKSLEFLGISKCADIAVSSYEQLREVYCFSENFSEDHGHISLDPYNEFSSEDSFSVYAEENSIIDTYLEDLCVQGHISADEVEEIDRNEVKIIRFHNFGGESKG